MAGFVDKFKRMWDAPDDEYEYDEYGYADEGAEEDYKEELKEFIASTSGHGYYEFDVANLRPNECKWLSGGMLIKPIDGKIKVHYQIHSDRSTGDLGGTLELYSD